MINPDLHIVMPHAVDQESLQMEQVIGMCQLQQPRELDASVALAHLPDKTDQRHVT